MMGQFTWRKMIGHLKVVLTHKWYVFQFMKKAGRPIQGLCHDLSKFSPIEFIESVRYFSGDRSPIDNIKDIKGYSRAWLHHRGRNYHHCELWLEQVVEKDKEPIPLLMPKKYAIEMICDWMAAGKAYSKGQGVVWTTQSPLEWYEAIGSRRRIHPAVDAFIREVYQQLASDGDLHRFNKAYLDQAYDQAVRAYWNRQS